MTHFISTLPPVIIYLLLAIYILLIAYTTIRILLDTQSSSKTLAYILLVAMFPLIGVILYFSVGHNYRQRYMDDKVAARLKRVTSPFNKYVPDETAPLLEAHSAKMEQYAELAKFVRTIGNSYLSKNEIELLLNGEEKFPEVLRTLDTARSFIHMEYYDWENDIRGNQIKDILILKMKEGVKVRVMYDAYASRKIKNNVVKELRAAGAEIYPVIKLNLLSLANRINHRDHRKVIIIDGLTGFIGGLNISDRYDNSIDTGLFWRDTHAKVTGPLLLIMQRHFIVHWNAIQANVLSVTEELFPVIPEKEDGIKKELAQIVAGGPIYPMSTIMLSYFKIFTLAKDKLYITNPYFIPNESILDALKQAAVSGVDVRIILPKKSDSAIVGAASKFYFSELLKAGVKIYMYRKGFVHAKTVVADEKFSVVGTANMDIRSFDLNFEIMSLIYGKDFAGQLEKSFLEDLIECDELNYEDWLKQSTIKKLSYATARLISSFL